MMFRANVALFAVSVLNVVVSIGDVMADADWIIDLGPEGGDGGGEIVAQGTPEDVVKVARSYTGQFLKPVMARKEARRAGKKRIEAAE